MADLRTGASWSSREKGSAKKEITMMEVCQREMGASDAQSQMTWDAQMQKITSAVQI